MNMMIATTNSTTPSDFAASYYSHYSKQFKFYTKSHITIEEPLKPYANFQQLKTAKVKRAKSTAEQTPKPFIQLQGQWLDKAGFSINKNCLIEVYKGMLVITLDEPIDNEEDQPEK